MRIPLSILASLVLVFSIINNSVLHANKLYPNDSGETSYTESVSSSLNDSTACVLKNREDIIPIDLLNRKISSISFGGNSNAFLSELNLYSTVGSTHISDPVLLSKDTLPDLTFNDILIVSFHAEDSTYKEFNTEYYTFLNRAHKEKVVALVFGTPEHLDSLPLQNVDALIYCNGNAPSTQKKAAQLLFGAIGSAQSNSVLVLKGFDALQTKANGRLKFTEPEDVGIPKGSLKGIGRIAENAIKEGAFPGCQVVVAVKGSIIYRESFGNHTYNPNSAPVTNDNLYDIASITKIAGSTLIAMYLEYRNMLDIDDTLGKYIPEITGNTAFSQIRIREMMAHQAGLKSWIPFYLKTISDGKLNRNLYRRVKDSIFSIQVADNIYLKNTYPEKMYQRILNTNLGSKKYKYSDLCYYFTQKVFEHILQEKQETFLHEMIYEPLGLRNIRYLPLDYFEKSRIVPTEQDTLFRKQLLHGHVHDPGAAMLGGVGGHAGIFSNATDLASIMQIFLQNGTYAGMTLFDEELRKDYTRKQFEKNRRGVGFDRPRSTGGGTCDYLASEESFGHSGFTGALAWADPKHDMIFVFLSNRVHPDQENWKIRDMNIRTDMQHVVYKALGVQKD